MKYPRLCLFVFLIFAGRGFCSPEQTQQSAEVDGLITWLLAHEDSLDEIPFADVVESTSGKKVLPVDPDEPVDAAMLMLLERALNRCMEQVKSPTHPIHEVGRVNEISRYIEDALLVELNSMEGFSCDIPLTAAGEHQRSGYPDLRFVHKASGRVFYVDPKIHKYGSETSSFRTFYFEPKGETNKILDDASHLIVGVSHSGKVDDLWQFNEWQIVDLAQFKVRLKAEFQASNRDMYREEAILKRSYSEEMTAP